MLTVKTSLTVIAAYAAIALAFVLSFAANAFAAGAMLPDDSTPLLDLLRPVYEAFAGGHRVAAGALALVAAVALIKRYSSKLGTRADAFLHSDVGGSLATLALAFFGAVAAATSTGALTWGVLTTSGGIAVAAVGGYTLIKKLILDRLQSSAWFVARAPGWLKLAVALLDPPSAIAVAERAGDAAVQASPATGADGVAGPSIKF